MLFAVATDPGFWEALQLLGTAAIGAFVALRTNPLHNRLNRLRAELKAERARCDKLEQRVKKLEGQRKAAQPKKKPVRRITRGKGRSGR